MSSLFMQDRLCPKCGTRYLGNPAFCGTCGAPIALPSAQTPAEPAFTPPAPPASRSDRPVSIPATATAPPHVPLPAPPTGSGMPENQFIGPYRLQKVLGRGGMGVVYLGMRDDGAFRKQVAIKLLLREMVNEEFILRFKQERQVLAALDHPNIARILDGGDGPDGLPYYVMEFVEGMPIDEYCDKQAVSLTGRIQIFQQVCQAVHYLNQNSIVHRDLKPSNVLVSNDGVVKLLDFGIAKVVGAAALAQQDLTGMDVRPMTPAYASPEQIEGKTLTKASDIYSLGVILYKLLTGRLPFADFDDKVSKLSTGKSPTPPSSNIREDLRASTDSTAKLRRALAGELDSIVLKALSYNPQERYHSASELSADLQRFLDGNPVTAHHTTAIGRSVRQLRRQWVAAAAVAGLLALGVFAAWQWQRMHTPAAQTIAQRNSAGTNQPTPVDKPSEVVSLDPNSVEAGKPSPSAPLSGQSPDTPAVNPADKKGVGAKTAAEQIPHPPATGLAANTTQVATGSKPGRGGQLGGQAAQEIGESTLQTGSAETRQPPVAPGPVTPPISDAERKDLEDTLDAAQAKVVSADSSMEALRQRLQQQNDALPADVVSSMSLMHAKMDRAKRDLDNGNYASAKENMAAAQALANKLLKRVGR